VGCYPRKLFLQCNTGFPACVRAIRLVSTVLAKGPASAKSGMAIDGKERLERASTNVGIFVDRATPLA
jgi:hypothetical protein